MTKLLDADWLRGLIVVYFIKDFPSGEVFNYIQIQ